jgi:serine/threonine-protein kinase
VTSGRIHGNRVRSTTSRTTGDAIDSDDPGTKSIYYRRATISCSQGASALPFDDLSGVNAPSAFSSYRVLHQIGSGVLGPVFRAHDSSERLVAIKALKLDLVPEDADRLAESLRAFAARAAGVTGLVATLDCGTERGTAFLALEYLSGDALDVYLRQSQPLGLVEIQRLLTSVARTIDAAWEQGISHGALHPRDIFVGGNMGRVTITGFGVTQALEETGAKTPVRLPYSAPERTTGAEWDRRADIYALGAIAREVAGRSAASELPLSWKKAIARAMAEDPAARFDRATAFAEALTPAPEYRPAGVSTSGAPPPFVAGRATQAGDDSTALDVMRREFTADAGARIDIPVASIDVTRAHPHLAASTRPSPERFPWAATAAIGAAGVALGLVGGYYWGTTHARRAAPPPTAASAPASLPPAPETPLPGPAPADSGLAANAPQPKPSEARAERQAPAATRGSLFVDSRPKKASVIMDGRIAGQTPLLLEELSPGMHSVLIQLKGHRSVPSRVAIVAGEQTKLAVSLEQLAAVGSLSRNSR